MIQGPGDLIELNFLFLWERSLALPCNTPLRYVLHKFYCISYHPNGTQTCSFSILP